MIFRISAAFAPREFEMSEGKTFSVQIIERKSI